MASAEQMVSGSISSSVASEEHLKLERYFRPAWPWWLVGVCCVARCGVVGHVARCVWRRLPSPCRAKSSHLRGLVTFIKLLLAYLQSFLLTQTIPRSSEQTCLLRTRGCGSVCRSGAPRPGGFTPLVIRFGPSHPPWRRLRPLPGEGLFFWTGSLGGLQGLVLARIVCLESSGCSPHPRAFLLEDGPHSRGAAWRGRAPEPLSAPRLSWALLQEVVSVDARSLRAA